MKNKKTLLFLEKIRKKPEIYYKGNLYYQSYISLENLEEYNFPLIFYKTIIFKKIIRHKPYLLIKKGYNFKCNDLLKNFTDTKGFLTSNLHYFFLEYVLKNNKPNYFVKSQINILKIISPHIMNICQQFINKKTIDNLDIDFCLIKEIDLFKKK